MNTNDRLARELLLSMLFLWCKRGKLENCPGPDRMKTAMVMSVIPCDGGNGNRPPFTAGRVKVNRALRFKTQECFL